MEPIVVESTLYYDGFDRQESTLVRCRGVTKGVMLLLKKKDYLPAMHRITSLNERALEKSLLEFKLLCHLGEK